MSSPKKSSSDNGIFHVSKTVTPETNGGSDVDPYEAQLTRMQRFAKLPIGQFFLRNLDRLLWSVEKTINWLDPIQEPSTVFGTLLQTNPERPLPWIFFIPALFFVRVGLALESFFSRFLGRESTTPRSIIVAIQKRRRRIRYLKFVGKRNYDYKVNHSSDSEENEIEEKTTVISKFFNILFIPIYIVKQFFGFGMINMPLRTASKNNSKYTQEKKRKISELSDSPNGNCGVLNEESDEEVEALKMLMTAKIMELEFDDNEVDDPEYVPNEDEESESEYESDFEDEECENEADVETLCPSSEEELKNKEALNSEQTESDMADQAESDCVMKNKNDDKTLPPSSSNGMNGVNQKNEIQQKKEESKEPNNSSTSSTIQTENPPNNIDLDTYDAISDKNYATKKSKHHSSKKHNRKKGRRSGSSGRKK